MNENPSILTAQNFKNSLPNILEGSFWILMYKYWKNLSQISAKNPKNVCALEFMKPMKFSPQNYLLSLAIKQKLGTAVTHNAH